MAQDAAHQLVEQLFAAWNQHDPNAVAACYSPSYTGADIGEPNVQTGRDGIRLSVERYLQAFPDLQIKVDNVIVQGEQVALRWTGSGTHRGMLMNIPPTGRRVEIRGMSMLTLDEDGIRSGFYLWDVAGMLRSIRLLPEL